MDASTLIRTARRRAGLSQRELARRARTSGAAVCLYERGERVPRIDTLERLLAAADASLILDVHQTPDLDLVALSEDLSAVLGLADALPQEHEPTLSYPPFASLVRR